MIPTLAWSQFALKRHLKAEGRSHFQGTPEELLELVRQYWHLRVPGQGRENLLEVVLVPVAPERFLSSSIPITEETIVRAFVHKRQEGEDLFIRVVAEGRPETARFAKVVLYSKDTLLLNGGQRSSDADWEVVGVIASPVQQEPMDPLTMARNMLGKPGGTPAQYSAEAFAEAIYYWSGRVRVEDK